MKCASGGRCISKKRICDNVIDCLDGEDEVNCNSKWIPKYKDSHPVQELNPRSGATIEYHTEENDREKDPILQSLDELKKSLYSATTAPKIVNNSVSVANDSVSDPWWQKEIHHSLDEGFGHVEKFTCSM